LPRHLFDNLVALNGLRNKYAHEIDVDLARTFAGGFVARSGDQLFPDATTARKLIEVDPATGMEALLRIRDATFGWLHEVARQHDTA
jgi:hypothetical protein